MRATKHCLTRTSPKGAAFVGKCWLCGKEGLTLADMESSVCANPGNISQEKAVLDAVRSVMSNRE